MTISVHGGECGRYWPDTDNGVFLRAMTNTPTTASVTVASRLIYLS